MPINFPNCYCQCYCSPNQYLQPQATVPFSNAQPNFCKCTSFTPRGFYPNEKVFVVCCNECVIRSPKDQARSYKSSSSSIFSSGDECCCCNKCAFCTLNGYRKGTKRKSRKVTYGNCCCGKDVQLYREDKSDGRHRRSKRSRYKDKECYKCACRCKSQKENDVISYEEYSKSRRKSHRGGKRSDYEDVSDNEDSIDTRSVISSKKQSKTPSLRLSFDLDPKKQVKPASKPKTKEKSGKSKKSKAPGKVSVPAPAKKPPRERKEKVGISGHILGDMLCHESDKRKGEGKTAEDSHTARKLNIGRVQNTADALRIRLEEKDQLRLQRNEKLAEKQCKVCPYQQQVCKPCQMVP